MEYSFRARIVRQFLARKIRLMRTPGKSARSSRNVCYMVGYYVALCDVYGIIGVEYSITLDQLIRMFNDS